MNVLIFPFQKYHNKKGIGSTTIRVTNLLKYWPEASVYKYGEKPDVMIFQKVYIQGEYRSHRFDLHNMLDCPKILDICDPDWLGTGGLNKACLIKETVDAVDAIVTPTEPLAQFIRQLTDKPVRVIKDRFVVDGIGAPRQHTGDAKKVIWYGYSHNADTLRGAVRVIEGMGLSLTVMADEDPNAHKWANSEKFRDNYTFVKYRDEDFADEIQKHDICILPKGSRPIDRFKSENKIIKSQLYGTPVALDQDDLERLVDAKERNIEALKGWSHAKKEYDARLSVSEYRDLIDSLLKSKGV
jgi:hypothetical protein